MKRSYVKSIRLGFCATGEGGGVDNSCGKDGSVTVLTKAQAKKITVAKASELLQERGYKLDFSKIKFSPKDGTKYLITNETDGKSEYVGTNEIKSFLTTDKTEGLF